MQKGFSPINIFIIIGIIALAYIGYRDYYLKKNIETESPTVAPGQTSKPAQPTKENQENPSAEGAQVQPSKEPASEEKSPAEDIQPEPTPEPETESEPAPQPEPQPEPEPTEPTTDNGYYENPTYRYAITVPADWPLKIRKESEVSLGKIPPQDGQGAITIEVSQSSAEKEIQEMKDEAEKYSGLVNITEEEFALSGISGTKITLENVITKTTDVYFILENYNNYYSIKYTQGSAGFNNQAEAAIKTFKFTK